MNPYTSVVEQAQEVRNQHLSLGARNQRKQLKSAWETRLVCLLEWERAFANMLKKAEQGRHGIPKSLLEDKRLAALGAWLDGGCTEEGWQLVSESSPAPRPPQRGGWVLPQDLMPVEPEDVVALIRRTQMSWGG